MVGRSREQQFCKNKSILSRKLFAFTFFEDFGGKPWTLADPKFQSNNAGLQRAAQELMIQAKKDGNDIGPDLMAARLNRQRLTDAELTSTSWKGLD